MAAPRQDHCEKRVGNEAMLSRLSSGLNQLRQQESFCDVVIHVGDQRFPAHKAVLCSTSDYFQGMFSSGFQESTMNEITIPGTEESFAQILEFAYTGYFMLSVQTISDILKMACFMLFTEAIEQCAEYIKEVKDQLPLHICFEIWSVAINHPDLANITKLCQSRLLQNFLMCVKLETFIQNVSACSMKEFLSDEEIEMDTVTEEDILQGVLSWLQFDWDQRKVHAIQLLQNVRLGLIPVDQLRKILGEELMAISECRSMVGEVEKLKSVNKGSVTPSLIKNYPRLFASRKTTTAHIGYRPRTHYLDPNNRNFRFLSLGCVADSACHRLDRIPDLSYELPIMECNYTSMAVYIANGHLYVGGALYRWYYPDEPEAKENERQQRAAHWNWVKQNNLFRYDAGKNEWIVLSPMPVPLASPKIIPLQDSLYFVSSGDDMTKPKAPSAILRYDIHLESWRVEVEDFQFGAFNYSQILEINGCILIYGASRLPGPHLYRYNRAVKFVVYKPVERKLVDVTVDNADFHLESFFNFFKSEENMCYMVRYNPLADKTVFQVDFDFDCDNPNMIIRTDVHQDPSFIMIRPYPEHQMFTFDKRRVGMRKVKCDCKSHGYGVTLEQSEFDEWHR